jgi:hypothetical protein
MRFTTATALLVVLARPTAAFAQQADAPPFSEGMAPAAIAPVAIYPPADDVVCRPHAVHEGDPVILGDAAGMDCTVTRNDAGATGHFPRAYLRDGAANEDWYGWGAALYAPFDGVVEEVRDNPVTNRPGERGDGPAGAIVFRRADGVRVVYGHAASATVRSGDRVTAGQAVARIGNNGFAWFPHVHVGAWKGREAVQPVIDPRGLAARQRAAAGVR